MIVDYDMIITPMVGKMSHLTFRGRYWKIMCPPAIKYGWEIPELNGR